MTNLILLGPPGCGKGTQSKILVEKKNFLQISTGELLRNVVNSDSDIGKEISKIMKNGDLVSDEIVVTMILKEISTHPACSFIFDGFPRNIIQAEKLDEAFNQQKLKLDLVIFLDVELNILKNRIEKRIRESNSEQVREDDNVDILLKRINTYKEMTFPLLEYYRKQEKLVCVNGMETIDKISEKIALLI